MRLWSRLALLLTALFGLGHAPVDAQAPPVLPPPELQQRIDGYDMAGIYQRWHDWVEREKGPVLETIVRHSPPVDGLSAFAPILRFTRHGVSGPFVIGEVSGYCRRADSEPFGPIAGSCVYRFTRSALPAHIPTDRKSAALLKELQRQFDPSSTVARLRAAGVAPKEQWGRDELDRVFAAGPSPRPLLRASALTVQIDSRTCPAFGDAIERLEGSPIEARIDLPGVGADAPRRGPGPHAAPQLVTLFTRNGADVTEIEDSGGVAARLAKPILDAAGACEVAQR